MEYDGMVQADAQEAVYYFSRAVIDSE